ncbi:zinc-finger homeodomain protein 5-like [Aristolochia californica]|uniref:zinc-finger homeodomain protein 5-like n=1 Tax=Aristolochia californica TaxID=171875 RepID=UPI0035E05B3F
MDGRSGSEVYLECQKIRDECSGYDGCKMFMPDTVSWGGLFCARCGCIRDNHRRVVLTPPEAVAVDVLSLGFLNNANTTQAGSSDVPPKKSRTKRSRTCFSEHQKTQMHAFAGYLGWKLGRKEKNIEIKQFCTSIGVRPQSFKTWLRSNKPLPAPEPDSVISISSSSSSDTA